MAESDRRLTPEWLLNVVREFGPIHIDPCTEPHNPTNAKIVFTAGMDGLGERWASYASGGLAWCNPPYSAGQLDLWARKAIAEARMGCEIIMLTPSDSSTKWYRLLADNADARCLMRRRVGFLEPDGAGGWRALPGAKSANCIWFFGSQRRRFARVFGAVGETVHSLGPQELDAPELAPASAPAKVAL